MYSDLQSNNCQWFQNFFRHLFRVARPAPIHNRYFAHAIIPSFHIFVVDLWPHSLEGAPQAGAAVLSRYCQLKHGSSLTPKLAVNIPAFFKFGKRFKRLAFVAVDLPTADAFTVFPGALDKPHHIS